MLNTKRVAKEEFRNYYYRKNRDAYLKKRNNKEEIIKHIQYTLEEINKSLLTIKKTNCEISVGCSTQIKLACEMENVENCKTWKMGRRM